MQAHMGKRGKKERGIIYVGSSELSKVTRTREEKKRKKAFEDTEGERRKGGRKEEGKATLAFFFFLTHVRPHTTLIERKGAEEVLAKPESRPMYGL